MYVSIINLQDPGSLNLIETYVGALCEKELCKPRPTLAVRRIAALAVTRDLLVRMNILSFEQALATDIERHSSGEPYLSPSTGHHLSISHSGRWIACLISKLDEKAGIDLEDVTRPRNFMRLAEHHFSAEESAYVRNNGVIGFYKIWTAKEAIAKAQGQGLSTALQTKIQLDDSATELISPGYKLDLIQHQQYVCTMARA